ncbi:MAG TPA: lysylphosphatidylglycerol synthase transmembrane domain-containing protein [Longimicrobiales bacterium]|nr:lysylphosphatidylglycerol synthase transmembrane domain-containing protein [Longimicrobiales bacterium]
MRHWKKALVGILITVLLLWWALAGVTFSEVWANVRTGNPWLLLASISVATFGFFIRALRWKVLLTPLRPNTALRSRFAAVSIGFMANNLLPARVGEVGRAYAFARLEPVSASAAFGTLVVERFMDGAVLLLLLVVPVFAPGFPAADAVADGWVGTLVRAGGVSVLVVLAALIVMAAWPKQFTRTAALVARFLPRRLAGPVLGGLDAFLSSLAILRDPKLLVLGFAWSLFFWTWHGLSFWLGILAFGIDTGFLSAIFTEAVVGFGVALPSAPGFFGTFHAAANVALSNVYGVPEAQSLAFAFAYHFGGWVPITAIGLWYAWRLGLSLGEVSRVDAEMGREERAGDTVAPRPT